MTVLKLGDRGSDVARLQVLLNSQLTPSPQLTADGVFGKMTEAELLRFQALKGIEADGVVGPRTWMALGQQATSMPTVMQPHVATPTRPWMSIAQAELGVHENAAPGQHNARILEYHRCTSLRATTDEVPWCSSYVNWVMLQSGRRGTNSAAAKSWLDWGQSLTTPQAGAITVIKKKTNGSDRATGSTSGFHVAFLISINDTHVRLLGGNQSDQVKYSSFSLGKYDVKGHRWPLN